MLGRAPRLPEWLLTAVGDVRVTRQDEEEIREPVQVDERQRVRRMLLGCCERLALRTAAGRSGDVQSSRCFGPSREHEAPKLGQIRVDAVAVSLQRIHLLLSDTKPVFALHRHREICPEVEELVLDADEDLPDCLGAFSCEDDPEPGVHFVDGPVRGDSRVEFRDTGAVTERRLTRVAAPCVDPCEPNRLVPLPHSLDNRDVIRRARDDEAEAVAGVFVPSFRGLPFLSRIHSDEEIRKWIRDEMLPSHDVWVAESERRVIGFAALHDDLLGHLYVHPEAQRRGVGSALLDVVKEERPAGFRLWVFQRNEDARRFYERHGCTLVELTDGSGNDEREPDALYAWRP
jgi:GNAT superfamily N-acetyltransferase